MYVFPEAVSGALESAGTKTSRADGALTIVSTESLTPEQMAQARPLQLFGLATQN